MTPSRQQLLTQGFALHQAGRFAEAEQYYQQALALNPNDADALHLLGLLAHQAGQTDLALKLVSKAVEIEPNKADFWINLGNLLEAQKRSLEAVEAYRKGLSLRPEMAQGHSNLGVSQTSLGNLSGAEESFRRAIALAPNFAEAYFGLGNVLMGTRKFAEAVEAFSRATEIRPNYPRSLSGMGNALFEMGRHKDAVQTYLRLINLTPNDAEAWHKLGMAQAACGLAREAVVSLRRSADIQPKATATWNNLGHVLRDMGDLDGALEAFERALSLGEQLPVVHNNIGNVYRHQGLIKKALAEYRQAFTLDPAFHQARSNYLLTLHYDPDIGPGEIFQEHLEWDRRHAQALNPSYVVFKNDFEPDRRLRIGYVSGDLRTHPVAALTELLFAHHDHVQFEVFIYYTYPSEDEITQRFKKYADAWRSVAALTDSQLFEQIQEDQIDFLVDLSGHTPFNRLLVFARRPAPVQITQQGYPDTTGLPTMDYCFTDEVLDPVGTRQVKSTNAQSPMQEYCSDSFHTEKLIRLPRPLSSYKPWAKIETSEAPALENGLITFGSLTNLPKLSGAALDAWCQILRRLPNARLNLLVSETGSEAAIVAEHFRSRGIEPGRLTLLGRRPHDLYLAAYNDIDIALDPFPYNGTATTCDALFMSVPVLTLEGLTRVQRTSAAIIRPLGLDHWICPTVERYIDSAVTHAQDVAKLAELRRDLRKRFEQSLLCDGESVARETEKQYRLLWRRWCEAR